MSLEEEIEKCLSFILAEREDIFSYMVPSDLVKSEDVGNYFYNAEHGFFHGVCACISVWASFGELTKGDIASILLHDFYKAAREVSLNHDVLLVDFFNSLNEETYVHSDPPAEFNSKPLIIADREELFRYENANSWVNPTWRHRDFIDLNVLDSFYNDIRPEMESHYFSGSEKGFLKLIFGIENYLKNFLYDRVRNINAGEKDENL